MKTNVNSLELNKILILEFSNLKSAYIEEVEWQEGDNTGSHIEEHKIKLEEFKKNPTIREGMKNLSEETIKKQQERRILHLEREIKAFGKNIDDIVKKY